MKVIKQRFSLLVFTSSTGLLTALMIFFKYEIIGRIDFHLVLVLVLLVTALQIGLLVREFGRYKAAKLIMENKIMYIKAAQIEGGAFDKSNTSLQIGGIEVYISCFGILLHSRVIKFNIDKVRLKAVDFSNEFICLTYGTNKTIQKIRILHGAIGKEELQCFIKKFRYETGVVPVITHLQ